MQMILRKMIYAKRNRGNRRWIACGITRAIWFSRRDIAFSWRDKRRC